LYVEGSSIYRLLNLFFVSKFLVHSGGLGLHLYLSQEDHQQIGAKRGCLDYF